MVTMRWAKKWAKMTKVQAPRTLPALGILAVLLFSAAACSGYGFRRSDSPLLKNNRIESIYVAPLINNTFKAGVENLVYNEMIRTFSARGGVKLVSSPEAADAILEGKVTLASYASAGSTTADNLFPSRLLPNLQGSPDIYVATEYVAQLSAGFVLKAKNPRPSAKPRKPRSPGNPARAAEPSSVVRMAKPGAPGTKIQPAEIWASGFSRAKGFPATNQLDAFGNTSPLINESEFDRALKDLAESLTGDLHESILAGF